MLIIMLGLVVGFIMALTGAGGGILAVPLLIFSTSLTLAQAGPIGLLAVGMSAALGAALGLRNKIVRYRAALLMAIAGVICSPVGIWLASRLNEHVMVLLFSSVLLLVAHRTFQQANHTQQEQEKLNFLPCNLDERKNRFIWTHRCARALATFGGVAGLLSGLLGVGGGFVMVPALQRYTNLPMKSVIATSLAVIALVSLSGAAASAMTGGINWSIAILFCGGTLSGIVAGSLILKRLVGAQLQKAFAMVSVLVALGMLSKTFLFSA